MDPRCKVCLQVSGGPTSPQRSNVTPSGTEGGVSNPLGPCRAHLRSKGPQSSHPWEICKSKLLIAGGAEADLNVRGCKMSWSSGRWGAELCSDLWQWHGQRGLHLVASHELSLPRAASLEEIGSSCFVQLFLYNVCIVGEGKKTCASVKNPLLWIGNRQ